MTQPADTSHINKCREVLNLHAHECRACYFSLFGLNVPLCPVGANLFDEYRLAISAHPDVEHIAMGDLK